MVTFKVAPPPSDAGPFAMPHIIVDGARKFTDLRYSDAHRSNLLDVYLPESGQGPFPTIIFIHGGAFRGGEKDDFQISVVIDGLNRGFAVVSVEQRLTDDGGVFPYPIFDFKAAIRFLRANAATYLLDPDRFATAGTSAGGYHALMAAATQEIPAFEDLSMGNPDVSSRVQAAIGLFGVYDLVAQSEFSFAQGPYPGMTEVDDFAALFLGVDPRKHPALAYFADPTNFVTPALPPALIQGGELDEVVPTSASVALAEKIRAVCGESRVRLDVIPGAFHGDEKFNAPENQDIIFNFLADALK
ncbi:MAG: alpha/beta hydrolase [Oscillospiraceae bacterium]|jgi:acetyl esterase/lipase|nr:alpha/beta hydrolase [Oscillospiraceae bacterium]